MMPVFFQAIGYGRTSLLLSLLRQIVCLLPLFWLLAGLGLQWTWFAFPLSELISGGAGLALYLRAVRQWKTAGNQLFRTAGSGCRRGSAPARRRFRRREVLFFDPPGNARRCRSSYPR